MQALLKGDPANGTPSLRGAVDLIYIDPPFDSKADYRTKIILPGGDVVQKPTVIEQFGYSDLWQNGTVSYLEYMYPRLVLMRELLSDHGSIYVHIDWHVGHYMKVILDDIFGKENFVNEVIWYYRRWNIAGSSRMLPIMTRCYIMVKIKGIGYIINSIFQNQRNQVLKVNHGKVLLEKMALEGQ